MSTLLDIELVNYVETSLTSGIEAGISLPGDHTKRHDDWELVLRDPGLLERYSVRFYPHTNQIKGFPRASTLIS